MPVDDRSARAVCHAGIGDLELRAACRERSKHLLRCVGNVGEVRALKHGVHPRLGDEVSRGLCRGFQLHGGEDEVAGFEAAEEEDQHDGEDQRELDRRCARPVARKLARRPAPNHENGSFRKITVAVNAAVPVPGLEPVAVPRPAQQLPPLRHAPTQGMMKGRG